MTNGEYLKRSRDESSRQGLTERYIQGQITYHQTGAQYYAEQGEATLAKWSLKMVDEWRAKLPPQASNAPSVDGLAKAAATGAESGSTHKNPQFPGGEQ